MKQPSKNLIVFAACAVALVTSGCANSDRGSTTATQDKSLNRSETGVGDGGVGGSGAGNAGPGGAGSIGGAGGHGGGGR